jgi:hypothetical protein
MAQERTEGMDQSIQRRPEAEIELFLQNWELKKELATTLLRSGFLPTALKTPEQVIAVMLKGQELGIPPMEALNSINVVNGKPTVSPQLMLALARRSKELEDLKIERLEDAVMVTVKRKGQSPHSTRFGAMEARALNLNRKDNYIKQPFTMYQWRALAANLRVTFPDIIGGLYTPEEMGADVEVTADGTQIFVTPEGGETRSEQPHVIEMQGTTFQTFDPTNETITFGKYAGAKWSEVPESYLHWLQGNATSREVASRAEATLSWRDARTQRQEQGPSVIDELFPPGTQSEDSEAVQSLFDQLFASLDEVSVRHNADELKHWAEQNMTKIETLSEEKRAALRTKYRNALDQANEPS